MKLFHDLCRYLVPRVPFGKTTLINLALKLGGSRYDGVITVADGRKFVVDDINSGNRTLFFLGDYESSTTAVIRRFLRPGMTVVDIGANVGWFTTLMARAVGDSGKVFAFDISERLNAILTKTVTINEFQNVTVERIALSDRVGMLDFFESAIQGTANLKSALVFAGSQMSTVPTMPLDSYLSGKGIKNVDLIKCDIDGAEQLFIDGAPEILRPLPVMVIEIADQAQRVFGHSAVELVSRLLQMGYDLFDIERGLAAVGFDNAESVNNTNVLCLAPESGGIISRGQ